MTKPEMTKFEMMTKHENRMLRSAMTPIRHSSFGFHSSFVIRHSSFAAIRHWSFFTSYRS